MEAARQALASAGRDADEVDLIIVATTTPDLTFPATAALVQRKLGAPVCPAFDVQAVCTGFVYALAVADGFVAQGLARCALVIGADCMSRLLDWNDRSTCVLLGDGAGAVEAGYRAEGRADHGGPGACWASRFARTAPSEELLTTDGGVSSNGQGAASCACRGNRVFRHAVINIAEAVEGPRPRRLALNWTRWTGSFPHQANQRILNGVAHRLGLPENKVVSTVADHANTSAASIPLALNQAVADGRVKAGELLLLEAMGGGLTWGALRGALLTPVFRPGGAQRREALDFLHLSRQTSKD